MGLGIDTIRAAAARRKGRARESARPARRRWWLELAVIAWLLWVYDAINNLAPLRLHSALENARGVLHLERALHIDAEAGLNRWLTGHHTLGTILANYYDDAHFAVTLVLLGWLFFRRADIYGPLRNLLVVVNVIGFAVFWRYPVAPPRMLPGFTDVVSSDHALANFHAGALASQANQFAAMPSLHMAWAAWCTLVLWRLSARRWVRALAIAYPCATAVTVVATGNHFVLDLVAGLLALLVAALLLRAGAAVWEAWRARRADPAGRREASVPATPAHGEAAACPRRFEPVVEAAEPAAPAR